MALKFFGPGGHLSGVLGHYLAYYRRDFHPTQIDDEALLEAGRIAYERATRGEAATHVAD